jgi:hypothetical protein
MRNVPKHASFWHRLRFDAARLALRTIALAIVMASAHAGMVQQSLAGNGSGPSVRQMLGDPLYWPSECSPSRCVLTGNGGILDVWLHHVDENRGKVFVVKGRCASACEWAYLRARRHGEKTVVLPGARFERHDPVKAKWR